MGASAYRGKLGDHTHRLVGPKSEAKAFSTENPENFPTESIRLRQRGRGGLESRPSHDLWILRDGIDIGSLFLGEDRVEGFRRVLGIL